MKNKGYIKRIIATICGAVMMAASVSGCGTTEQEEQYVQKEIVEDGISAYEKLRSGQPVNLLVVGDSIGFGTGSQGIENRWPQRISAYMNEKYGSEITIENVSMGGCSSICGYVRTMALNDGIDYDLGVVCYGENDAEEDFGLYYESILRALKSKYPAIEIICIQESSQREYTYKMQTIAEIAEHYHIPVADTIEPFSKDYDSLVVDGTHPNNDGYKVYAQVLEEIIDEKVSAGDLSDTAAAIEPYDEAVKFFDDFLWIPGSSFKKRGKKLSVKLDNAISGEGVFFLADINDYPGDDNIRVMNNDKEVVYREFDWPYEFAQRHIPILLKGISLEEGIMTLEFDNKKQIDDFEGVGFIGISQ